MANDGLIFRFLATIHPRFKTPFTATLLTGLIAAVFAMLTELDALVDMMSIGTLLAYTLVAVSILVVRYEFNPSKCSITLQKLPWQREPTRSSSRKSKLAIFAYCISAIVFCFLCTLLGNSSSPSSSSVLIALLVLTTALIAVIVLYLSFLPRAVERVYFMVPFVPLIPALSILINVYLMFQLPMLTWLRLAFWMMAGFLIYGCYGLKHSSLESPELSSYPDEDLCPLVEHESFEEHLN